MDLMFGIVLAVLATLFAVFKWSGNTETGSTKPEVALERSKTETPNAVVVQSTSAKVASLSVETQIPQDSVLKRHYLAHVQYMIETVSTPRPTDSVLRRHYDHFINAELSSCLEDAAKLSGLVAQYDESRGLAA